MEPVVLDNISFNLDQESLMKEMRIKNSYIAKFKGLMEEALAIAKPKAIYKKAVPESMGDSSIVIDGVTLNSRVVTVNLQGISEFFPAVATCGKELEEWANSFDDMLLNFWANVISEKAMRSAIEALDVHLKENFKLDSVAKMNPGSVVDWSIQEQRKLFTIIGNVEELIGVRLTKSSLMLPMKT
ncbi:MAG: vitamin B12 dependent methionine synthase, partial [Bacillota bacterium]|nr:vitamin B12 dependent methionine synthase [Bacillota bacterium]